jgi:hypothetical protein
MVVPKKLTTDTVIPMLADSACIICSISDTLGRLIYSFFFHVDKDVVVFKEGGRVEKEWAPTLGSCLCGSLENLAQRQISKVIGTMNHLIWKLTPHTRVVPNKPALKYLCRALLLSWHCQGNDGVKTLHGVCPRQLHDWNKLNTKCT